MDTRPVIVLLRSGNRLVVDPTTSHIKGLLTDQLSYIEQIFHRGKELWERKRAGLSHVEEVLWQCYSEDHKNRLGTSFGFYERIKQTLQAAGYRVKSRWATKEEHDRMAELHAKEYLPDWSRIDELVKSGFEFRYKQRECLEIIANHYNGRIDCPPGWGKGTEIMLASKLFPRAKIDVITKNVAVLTQRLYPELTLNLPSVGIACGGKKITGRRVMCISADSYRYFRPEADIVFIDEGHQACADAYAARLACYEHARMFAFSASWDLRLDNKNLRGEAMFGPVRLRVTYKEAEQNDMVVPIEVVWSDVIMDVNPCGDSTGVDKKRLAYWANDYRNSLIAKDAHCYDENVQTLITVETVEHALWLKQHLPEFTMVYSGMTLTDKDLAWFDRQGILPENFRIMTPDYKQLLTKRFESGKLKKVIATPVWNVGVNFKQLQVLIRADGGGSPINDIQIPGRTSRLGKSCGIIHDYRDQFDRGCTQKSQRREQSYTNNEWKQHFPRGDKRSLLRQLMQWGTPV